MRESMRGTYLLRDGRVCAASWPICYDRMKPPPRDEAARGGWPGGLWAEVPHAASGEPQGRRIVAWLSADAGPAAASGRRLHDFRQAVLRRYPAAVFIVYSRNEDAVPLDTPMPSSPQVHG